MKIDEIIATLNTHKKCIKYLERVKWERKPQCPYCSCQKSSSKGLRYTCYACGNSFSVTIGTIFESSKVPLPKWFIAIKLILSAKKGISSRQLSRQVSVNKDTAWLMQLKIRSILETERQVKKAIYRELKIELVKHSSYNQQVLYASSSNNRINFYKSGHNLSDITFNRALYGQYHKLAIRYLNGYRSEQKFKYMNRDYEDNGWAEFISLAVNLSMPLSGS